MLRLGGGHQIQSCMKIFGPHPFDANDAVRPQQQEFLGCSNEEMNGKSIRTDFNL